MAGWGDGRHSLYPTQTTHKSLLNSWSNLDIVVSTTTSLHTIWNLFGFRETASERASNDFHSLTRLGPRTPGHTHIHHKRKRSCYRSQQNIGGDQLLGID